MRLIIIILSFGILIGDTIHSVSGTVINGEGLPIENVSVSIENLHIGSITDSTGYFIIYLPNHGSHEVAFTYIGYLDLVKILDSRTKKINIISLKIQSIPSDEVIITSLRKETNIKDSPILTQIINKNDIKNMTSSSVEELIQFAMPSIQSTHDNHGDEKIKIQGLDSKYVTFLVDGKKISAEFAGNVDFSIFNMNNIKRIEIVRGGLSTVYGSGAMAGVVNIVTQENLNPLWVSYNSFYDMPNLFSNSLELGFKIKKFSYSINLNHSHSDGYDLTEEDFNSGSSFEINKTLEEFTATSIDQQIQYNFNDKSIMKISYKDYSKDVYKYEYIPGFTFYQSSLPRFKDNIISLAYTKKLTNESSLLFTIQNENHSKSYYFPYYFTSQPTIINPNISEDGKLFVWSNPSVSTSSILYDFSIKSHSLLMGIDFTQQSYASYNIFSNNDIILEHSIFDEDKTEKTNETSLFILDNYLLNHYTELDLGIRFTYHSKYQSKVSPSVSVKHILNNYICRFNFSQSYRSPSLKELYYKYEEHGAGFPVIGNEDLQPSSSNYYSLSLESLEKMNNSIEIYYNNVLNMIANRFEAFSDEDPSIVYRYNNFKNVDLYGINLNHSFQPFKNTSIKSVYSYAGGNSNAKDVLDGVSAHSINIQLKHNLETNCSFTSFFNHILLSSKYNSSKIVDISLEDENNQRTEITLPDYYIVNFALLKNFKSGNYIKFGVKNIFDYINSNSQAPDFLSTYEPGRRFFINVNINLSKGIK